MITHDVPTLLSKKTTSQYGSQFVSWDDIKQRVEATNPELFHLIDDIGPSPQWKLVRARYPYGTTVLDRGVLRLPLADGSTARIDDPRLPKGMADHLSYHHVPLAVCADKINEVYLAGEQQLVPLKMLEPGALIGVFEFIDPMNSYRPISDLYITSGARSVFMLPKITDSVSHKRLVKEFKIRQPIPRHFSEQALVFAQIVNSPALFGQWTNEMIYFTKDWVEAFNADNKWLPLKVYFHEYAWQQSRFWRVQSTIGMLWKTFSKAMQKQHLKPSAYLAETVKHLLFIASGSIPAFRPQGISQKACPVKLIQQVYCDVYGLKGQYPTMMAPEHIATKESSPAPVYYSLSLPTLLDYSGQAKQQMTIIEEERAIKTLIGALEVELRESGSTLNSIFEAVKFGYFHTDKDSQQQIRQSIEIADEDSLFMGASAAGYQFAATSLFFRGCIRVAIKAKSTTL